MSADEPTTNMKRNREAGDTSAAAAAVAGDDDDDDDDVPDQEFAFGSDTGFREQFTQHVSTSRNNHKVRVTYRTIIRFQTQKPSEDKDVPEKQQLEYQQIRRVPEAVIERAKYDEKFNLKLCHAIAHSYHADMLQQLCSSTNNNNNNKVLLCHSCGIRTGTHIVQAPSSDWHSGPLAVRDLAGFFLCDTPECDAKAKDEFGRLFSGMKTLFQTMMEKQDVHCCLSCNKLSSKDFKLLRCSQCQQAYFCNKTCQKRAWKKHKKDCQKPSVVNKTE